MVRRATLISALALGLCVGTASGETFTFMIENIGVQPLSPVFVATHDATFDIFDEGAPASPEIEAIAGFAQRDIGLQVPFLIDVVHTDLKAR